MIKFPIPTDLRACNVGFSAGRLLSYFGNEQSQREKILTERVNGGLCDYFDCKCEAQINRTISKSHNIVFVSRFD